MADERQSEIQELRELSKREMEDTEGGKPSTLWDLWKRSWDLYKCHGFGFC